MRIALVVPFLNEAEHLPTFLESIAAQARPPDELLLVDDGSDDGSGRLAEQFAAGHSYARALRRPPRPRERDRLGGAAELHAFHWGVERLDPGWDLLAKVDADLQLTPHVLEQVEQRMVAAPRLGITGPFLSIRANGELSRERCPAYHVRGGTKFYRRACWEEIAPLDTILGWDTIDEVAARLHNWRTESFEAVGGDPVHMRPTGAVDGRLRAYRRWGACAYAIGDHPLWVALGAARRAFHRPRLLCAAAYLSGYVGAHRRGVSRAPAPLRSYVRREQKSRVRRGWRRFGKARRGQMAAMRSRMG